MFTISSNQFLKIYEALQDQFINAVIAIIKKETNKSVSDADLEIKVKQNLTKCENLRFLSEHEIALFVKASMLFGDNFEETNKDANSILNNKLISKEIKLEWLAFWCDDQKINI